MQAANKRSKTDFTYKMKGESLEKPCLGEELCNNMKYNLHIDQTCKKASRVLGFLKRNLKHCPPSGKERAHNSLVRPKLEYCSTIGNPHTNNDINILESVDSKTCFSGKNLVLQLVELCNNMKYNLHIDQTCKKASRDLGFLKRNLKHCPPSGKERAHNSLVRPKLEYCSTIGNPHTNNDINILESVDSKTCFSGKNFVLQLVAGCSLY
ncbi:unnamed protein product [Mytilus coruscus]|uniref:Uncharacterized protein n=1 Tax=Mytilus coruscus TaxID=42192 RepID=A0A6J8EU28_MYTCO|nr:unnamed protein product [Mytilus coruscus]